MKIGRHTRLWSCAKIPGMQWCIMDTCCGLHSKELCLSHENPVFLKVYSHWELIEIILLVVWLLDNTNNQNQIQEERGYELPMLHFPNLFSKTVEITLRDGIDFRSWSTHTQSVRVHRYCYPLYCRFFANHCRILPNVVPFISVSSFTVPHTGWCFIISDSIYIVYNLYNFVEPTAFWTCTCNFNTQKVQKVYSKSNH